MKMRGQLFNRLGYSLALIFIALILVACQSSKKPDQPPQVTSSLDQEAFSLARYESSWPELPQDVAESGRILQWLPTLDSLYIQVALDDVEAATDACQVGLYQYSYSNNQLQKIDITLGGVSLPAEEYFVLLGSDANGTVYFTLVNQFQPGKMDIWTLDQKDTTPKLWLTLPINFTPSSMLMTTSGYFYLSQEGEVYVADNTGKTVADIKDSSLTGQLLAVGEQIYGVTTDSLDNRSAKLQLREIHLSDQNLATGALLPSTVSPTDLYSAGSFICYSDKQGICTIDPNTGDTAYVLYWEQAGLLPSIQNRQAIFLDNSRQFLLLQEGVIAGMLYSPILVLNPMDSTLQKSKTEIILAGMDLTWNTALNKAIIDFNLMHSDMIIKLRDYGSKIEDVPTELYRGMRLQDFLTQDILSGQAPDIVFGLDIGVLETYEKQELLVDLMPLIKADPNFKVEDYLPLFNLSHQGDAMYYFSLGFSIHGLMINDNYIDKLGNWQLSDFNKLEDTLPEGVDLFATLSTREELLDRLLWGQLTRYVDYASGTANLQEESFGEFLQFAKTYGRPTKVVQDGTLFERMQNGQVLLQPAHIFTPYGYRSGLSVLGEEATVIGYPGGGLSPIIHFWNTCGILSSSQNQPDCWEFLSLLQSSTYQAYNTAPSKLNTEIYMSLRQDLFELQLDNAQQAIGYPSGLTFGNTSESPPLSDEQIQRFRQMIEQVTLVERGDDPISQIILEEAGGYFQDQKSLDQVIMLMENRIQTYLNEQK